jgi:CheY-like chemotaxis protein/HPt (histidine-containing phosphotransfer) domain-containing protein
MVAIHNNRAETYRRFEQQAQSLLSEIEQGLAVLAEDRSLPTIYRLVRASHTLKVDAANLNLELISNIASCLESICRSLGQESAKLEPEQKQLLKSTYRYLKILLSGDRLLVPQTRAETELVYQAEIETLLSDLQAQIAVLPPPTAFLPTAAELGIDLDKFILTEEFPQLLVQWEKILSNSEPNLVIEQLAIQAEICGRFGEVLGLPEFIEIPQVLLTVLEYQPSLAIAAGKLALIGLKSVQQQAQNAEISKNKSRQATPESLFTASNFSAPSIEVTSDNSEVLDSASVSFIASKHDNSQPPPLAIEELIRDYAIDEELLPEIKGQILPEAALEVPESQLVSSSSPSVTDESNLSVESNFIDTENLLVWQVGNLILTLPSSKILEICDSNSGYNSFPLESAPLFSWKQQQISLFHLGQLIKFSPSLSQKLQLTSKKTDTLPQPNAAFLIVVKLARETIAIDLIIDKLISQTYLEIQPFGSALLPPKYMYGCTLLEENKLLPVVDLLKLLEMQMPKMAMKSSKSTILIVDDSRTVREILRMTLGEAGYQVLMAENGEKAIQYCHEHPEIQLIICDIEMPKVNGFEFLVYHRQQPKLGQIPVVMLTFCSTDREKSLAMQLGASAYITKPYLKEDLLAIIKAILARSQN